MIVILKKFWMLILFLLVGAGIGTWILREKNLKKDISSTPLETVEQKWFYTDKNFQIITGQGLHVSVKGASFGGITLLPLGYKENNRDFFVTIRNLKDGSEVEKLILKDFPDLTSIQLLPNTIDFTKIWVAAMHPDSMCEKEMNNCYFQLFEFDLNTGETELKSKIKIDNGTRLSKTQSVAGFRALAHDPVLNQVWFTITFKDDNYIDQGMQFLDQATKNIMKKREESLVIAYNANTNISSNLVSSRAIAEIYMHNNNFDLDKSGNLYINTRCVYENCEELMSLLPENYNMSSDQQVYRFSTEYRKYPKALDIFAYGAKNDYGELAIDKNNNLMYLSVWNNQTWKIVKYDINKQTTMQVSASNSDNGNGRRGFLAMPGYLLIGGFDGLGIYNEETDEWRLEQATDNGVKSNNIEKLYPFSGGICMRHFVDNFSNDFSCYFGSIDNL